MREAEPLELVDAVVQLSFEAQRILGAAAAAHDLSPAQVRMLGILRDRRPGVVELAQALGLEKSSASGLIDRAQQRGLVARSPSPADGRGVTVSLTARGRRLVARVAARVGDDIEELLRPLSDRDRAQLARAITAALADRHPAPGAGRR